MLTAMLMIGIGGFALLGGLMNWDWFMRQRKAVFIVKLFGRNGARIFYVILGGVFLVIGLLFVAGVIGPDGG